MTRSTRSGRTRILVLFDFDLTLAPDSFAALLRHCGIGDPEAWRRAHVRPRVERGWEVVLARIGALHQLSDGGRGPRITHALVEEVGRAIEPFAGVPEVFGRLRAAARAVLPEIEVEYHLLTSGFVDIHRATRFADAFAGMWGTELVFDEGRGGALAFPKRIVTHNEKAPIILALARGIDPHAPNAARDAHRTAPDEPLHAPLDQVIYVGDGGTDIAAFGLLDRGGGVAIAACKPEGAEDWAGADATRAERRVDTLAPPGFAEGSLMLRALELAIGAVARRIALRQPGAGA